ncbi:PAS domain S-box protein [Aetokthonos hydrillicola Thurmond2011]|jgi:hypothetical protein|uniref:histidine kinase n=1 Tax=Aetokthonos hydrillicola Thurmond2011 TaxID=2712845 RepID=A0AAP5MCW4_9CYAN|nr:PAS domain S-box protein [Aetokthonos hydrillicola]MBO3458099.1 PAS domain S-box protein [Aetokthonos hydrillicola CCALA 1050]MBW4587064.1 PAS domain S-box protein [Aetokthonos hydrillicola CCALA 1050]MDR9899687.1 PAS domain S-box protein [Aetokthonos hydrillicola Thurmond2011]
MQPLAELLLLPSLNSAIDFSPITVPPDTPLLDVIELLGKSQPQANSVLVVENSLILGCFTNNDAVRLFPAKVDFKTTSICEVMTTSVTTVKQSDIQDITSVLSILRQHHLPLISVVNEQEQLIGCISCESVCQALDSYNFLENENIINYEQVEHKLLEAKKQLLNVVCGLVSRVNESVDEHCQGIDRYLAEATDLTNDGFTSGTQKSTDFPDLMNEFLVTQSLAVPSIIDGTTHNWLIPEQNYQRGTAAFSRKKDFTEHQQIQTSVIESERLFRDIFDGTFQLTAVLTPEGNILQFNKTALNFVGLQQKDVVGRLLWEIPARTISQKTENQLKKAIAIAARGEFVRYEVDILGAANTVATIDFSLKPMKGETGKVILIIAEGRDITELKSARAALEKAKQELEMRVEERTIAVKKANRQLILEMADRLLAEEQLRQSQEMLQLIMDNIPQCIFWKDTDSVYLGCNRNFARKAGFENPEDIVGKTDYDLLLDKIEAEIYHKSDATVIQSDEPSYHIVTEHLQKDGTKAWLETNKVPLHDAEGYVIGILGSFEDITNRKRAEEALQLRDRAIAASNNGIVICDVTLPDCPMIYANPAFERITGYSVAEVIGKNCRFLHGSDSNQPELKKLASAIQQAKGCTVVLRNYRKDGSLFWNELSISPVYDSNGKFTHYIGIQTDITERKLAETAVLLSQERLQYLLSSSPGVIYTCKPSVTYSSTFISKNLVTVMGYEAEEFLADPNFWYNHIHPEDRIQVFDDRLDLFEQGKYSVEYRFLHKNGTYCWLYDQAKLVCDDAGNPAEIVGYLTDITQRKQLEVELRDALEKEKELNELKSRFISMTSHEFRTPLSTIISSSELLEHYRHKWSEEKQITHLHRIQTAVKRMTEMLDDVLVIAKAEVGKLDCRLVPLDLVEYCLTLVEELQLNVKNQHTIAFSTPHQSVRCYMDEKLLGHILSNLLSNAIKYSENGSSIKFNLTCQQGQAIFEIQDQGIGIPPEDIPRLFESFYRATNVGNIQGTGLGLAIVKKCVDIYRGKITVNSQVGVGTTFFVTLPLTLE